MFPTQTVITQLKALNFPEDHVRNMRALFVAQSLAYQVTVMPGRSIQDHMDENESVFKSVVNQVNEALALDVRLCRAFFQKLLNARIDLVNNCADPALVLAVLNSTTQESAFSEDQVMALREYTALPGMGNAIRSMNLQLGDAFGEEVDNQGAIGETTDD